MSKSDWFFLGLMVGYFWYPLWNLVKLIFSNASKATKSIDKS